LTNEENWNRSLALLLEGEYDTGFPSHECVRTGHPSSTKSYEPSETYSRTIWRGETEPITLLVNADFGMGDTIQFWRFVPLARSRVARLILRCDEDFKTLFQGVELVGKDEPLPEFDKIIHMMAIPNALGVKKADISGQPYLKPNPVFPLDYIIDMVLTGGRSICVGVCWNGNPFNGRDSVRSMPEQYWEELDKRSWIRPHGNYTHFYSLDKLFGPPNK
jgi:hypothetical protein